MAAVGALAWTAAAPAATPPPPEDVPAVSAYVELIPTSRGSQSPRVEKSKARRTGGGDAAELPAGVEAQLEREGGRDAPLLKKLTTSREYGASEPRSSLPKSRPAAPRDQSPLGAGVGVVTDGSNGRMLVLAALLFTTTLAAAATAAYRRRGQPS